MRDVAHSDVWLDVVVCVYTDTYLRIKPKKIRSHVSRSHVVTQLGGCDMMYSCAWLDSVVCGQA